MPNSATGLLTGWGTGVESVYGTAVALTRWQEILSDNVKLNPVTQQSKGLYRSPIHLPRGTRRARTRRDATGNMTMEVPSVGFGRLLEHSIGGTPTIAQQGGTAAWLQTHAYGSIAGKYLTTQKQLVDATNTVVQQFTRVGCKIVGVEFTISKDGYLTASFDIDAQDENVSTAAGSPTYPTGVASFHFGQVSAFTIGGVAASKFESCSIKLARTMKQDGFYLGSGGLKAEPVEIGRPSLTGTLVAEFDSTAKTMLYDRMASDAGAALVLTLTGANISGIYNSQISFTIPEIHILGESPAVSGPDLVMISSPFESAWDGSSGDFTVTYQSTDTAV